jgi:hypothetical protein
MVESDGELAGSKTSIVQIVLYLDACKGGSHVRTLLGVKFPRRPETPHQPPNRGLLPSCSSKAGVSRVHAVSHPFLSPFSRSSSCPGARFHDPREEGAGEVRPGSGDQDPVLLQRLLWDRLPAAQERPGGHPRLCRGCNGELVRGAEAQAGRVMEANGPAIGYGGRR